MKGTISIKKCAADGAMLAALLLLINFAFVAEINYERKEEVLVAIMLVPAGGAIGGFIFYLLNPMRLNPGLKRTSVIAVCAFIYSVIISTAYLLALRI